MSERYLELTYAVGSRAGIGADRRSGLNGGSSISPVLAPAAFDRSTVDHLSLKLNNGHRSVLVRVEFDEGEATVGLHSDLGQVPNRLEERD